MRILTPLALLLLAVPAVAAEPDGFVPLFNGKDLSGWVNVNTAPGTFYVKGNEIVTTGKPTGFLRTAKQYENFVLEVEWMHVEKKKMANSGLFVWGDPIPAVGTPYTRGIEVQVLANYQTDWATSDGDVFSIHGAHCKPDRPHPRGYERCLPSEKRTKPPGQWNHYKIVADNGAIKLHVNGKEVSGVSQCTPRKGYLALESEGAECHFRNIRIKELPSSNPPPDQVAKKVEGFKSLFTGLDLSGWKTDKDSWQAVGGHLKATGKAPIGTDKKYGKCELIFDWKMPAKSTEKCEVKIGDIHLIAAQNRKYFVRWEGLIQSEIVNSKVFKPGSWNRLSYKADGKSITIGMNGQEGITWLKDKVPDAAPIEFQPAAGLEIMNVFIRELK